MKAIAVLFFSLAAAGCGSLAHPDIPHQTETGTVRPGKSLASVSEGNASPWYHGVCRNIVRRRTLGFIGPNPPRSSSMYLTNGWLLSAGHNFKSWWPFRGVSDWDVRCGAGRGVHEPDYGAVSLGSESDNDRIHVSATWWMNDLVGDYALVRVSNAAPQPRYAFNLPDVPPNIVPNKTEVFVAGFPLGDGRNGYFMQHAQGVVKRLSRNNRLIHYDVETLGGLSGGPVWILQNEEPVLVGIHVAIVDGSGVARRLDKALLKRLKRWMDAPATRVDSVE